MDNIEAMGLRVVHLGNFRHNHRVLYISVIYIDYASKKVIQNTE